MSDAARGLDDTAGGADLSPLERFATLLEHERSAALAADLDTLEALQTEKESVMGELTRGPAPDPTRQAEVAQRARSNIALLRQLTDLHRALLTASGDTLYGPEGLRPGSARDSRIGLRR